MQSIFIETKTKNNLWSYLPFLLRDLFATGADSLLFARDAGVTTWLSRATVGGLEIGVMLVVWSRADVDGPTSSGSSLSRIKLLR